MTARPSAVPIWAAALSTPEAMPCSSSGSASVPDAVEATAAAPRPAPISTKDSAKPALESVTSASAPAATATRPAGMTNRRATARAEERARDDRDVQRRAPEARLERGAPHLLLLVQQREEHRRRRRPGEGGGGDGRRDEAGPADRPRRQDRVRRPPLHDDEAGQRHRAGAQRRERHRVRDAARLDEREAEHGQCEPDRHGDRAAEVERRPRAAALLEHACDQRHGHEAERHVDEEDGSPAERLGEHAAEHPARGAAARCRRRPPRDRAPPLGGLGERDRQQGQRGRGGERGADALHAAAGDEHGRGGRQPAGERRRAEQRQAEREQAATAEQVARTARRHEQPAEGERVGADHPLQAGRGEAELASHRRQRHGHDRHVEDEQELGAAQERERRPASCYRCHACGRYTARLTVS